MGYRQSREFDYRSKPPRGRSSCLRRAERLRQRTIQIHPSLRCNLACQHCYSLSGPAERAELSRVLVNDLIDDATGEGYTTLAISGGEPTLWPGLHSTLARAKSNGLITTLTSNGLLLSSSLV